MVVFVSLMMMAAYPFAVKMFEALTEIGQLEELARKKVWMLAEV